MKTRDYLKLRFENGDFPTQDDFYELFDTLFSKLEDNNISIYALSNKILRKEEFVHHPDHDLEIHSNITSGLPYKYIKWTINNSNNEYVYYGPTIILNTSNFEYGYYNLLVEVFNNQDVPILSINKPNYISISINKVIFVVAEGQVPITNASVTFNGETKAVNLQGIAEFFGIIVGQEYPYSVTANLRPPVNDTVTINQLPQTVEVFMSPINVNSIDFQINDTNGAGIDSVNININGIGNETTDQNGTAIFTDVTPGTYNYTIEKTNYNTAVGQITVIDENVSETVVLESNLNQITQFRFLVANNNLLSNDITGTINQATGAISVTVPSGTDVTALIPTITINGDSVSPLSEVAQDFSNPVTYTVTPESGDTKVYSVTVQIESLGEHIIYGYRTLLQGQLDENALEFADIVTGVQEPNQVQELFTNSPSSIRLEFAVEYPSIGQFESVHFYFLAQETIQEYLYFDFDGALSPGAKPIGSAGDIIIVGDPIPVTVNGTNYNLYRLVLGFKDNYEFYYTNI